MKSYLKLILLAISLTHIETKKSKNQTFDFYYITNWDQYGMPKEIDIESLKKILNFTAQYKKLTYCPFKDPSECESKKYDNIISKIVAEVLANKTKDTDDDAHDYSNEDSYGVKPSRSSPKRPADDHMDRTFIVIRRSIDGKDGSNQPNDMIKNLVQSLSEVNQHGYAASSVSSLIILRKKHKKRNKKKTLLIPLSFTQKAFHVSDKYKKHKIISNMGPFRPYQTYLK